MNGIYLHLLLMEIRDDLIGASIQDIRIKGRIIQLMFNERSLYISLYPAAMGMFLAIDSDRSYEPLRAMSDMIKSFRITHIVQEDFVPVMKIYLERPFPGNEVLEAIVSFYPEAPNFSVRTESWQRNVFPRYIEKKPKSSVLHLSEERIIHADVDYLVKNIEGVDKKMAQEMNAETLRSIKSALQGGEINPKLVSFAPLHITLQAREDAREFSTLNELFETAIRRFEKDGEKKRTEQDQRRLAKNLKRRIARLENKLLLPEEVEDHRSAGELILANISGIKKGSSLVSLFDPYTGRQREIILDPHLSPPANAQKYFARYKKEKRGQPKLREQIAKLKQEMADVKAGSEFRVVRKEKTAKPEPVSEPFHRFDLLSGSIILVGKNARGNVKLTFEYARAGDYFFHARGVEGAHVMMRPNTPRGQRPAKDEIYAAAAIAAYFSKARKQHNVPVSYTQRKYLKKAKKGRPGSVIMMREEVVFVNPGLPSTQTTNSK